MKPNASQAISLPSATRTHLLRFSSDEALTHYLATHPLTRNVGKTILPLHAPGEVVCLLAEYATQAERDKAQALADREELTARRSYVAANARRIKERRAAVREESTPRIAEPRAAVREESTPRIAEPRAPYYCFGFPTWRKLAAEAISQEQTEAEFRARWHEANQSNARDAYRVEKSTRKK
jgi:hypothetical protein